MLRLAALVALAPLAGCSLVLNWDTPPDGPPDAPPDGPFTQEQCDYKEPNDSIETAAVVVPGTDTGPAAICGDGTTSESDFYKFTVPAGATMVVVRITFMNRPTGDIDLRLFDSTGTMRAQSRGFGDSEQIVCPGSSPFCMPALTEGDYVFEVFPALGGYVNNYEFAVEITTP